MGTVCYVIKFHKCNDIPSNGSEEEYKKQRDGIDTSIEINYLNHLVFIRRLETQL